MDKLINLENLSNVAKFCSLNIKTTKSEETGLVSFPSIYLEDVHIFKNVISRPRSSGGR